MSPQTKEHWSFFLPSALPPLTTTSTSFYLSFESFLEGEDGGVNGVLQFHVVVVTLLQERLTVNIVLAHSGRLPREVGPRRITLK